MNGNEEKNNTSEDFLRETVTNKGGFRRKVKRVFGLVFIAVVFGFVACLTFVVAKPYLEKKLAAQEVEETISLGEDESVETEPAETEAAQVSIEDVYEQRQSVITESAQVIVSVRAEVEDSSEEEIAGASEDEFLSGRMELPGICWSCTDSTGFILVDYSSMCGCTDFVVTLKNGTETEGRLRGADSITGIAVIGVDLQVLDEAGIVSEFPELASSRRLSPGDIVEIVGAPYGYMYSGVVGQVVYNEQGSMAEDCNVDHLIIDASVAGEGFVLDESGDIVGISTQSAVSESGSVFYGISSLRGIIEKLANGRQIAYMGLSVTGLGDEELSAGLPNGAYVDSVTIGSPAYHAGIQAGDIVTRVGDYEVTDAHSLQEAMFHIMAGSAVDVTVFRQGRNGSVEQHYTVETTGR